MNRGNNIQKRQYLERMVIRVALVNDDEVVVRGLDAMMRTYTDRVEVVELVAWADLSYADAAEALGVPVGTVRSRLSRARARLGAELLPVPQEVL